MRRVVVSCVVLVALVVPLGCAKSKGSKAEFCRELRRTSGLDEVLNGFATDDPATIRRKMREAADQFSKLERAAPREVRSDVTQVSDLVGKVVDVVDRSPDDPQEIAKRLRAVALTAGGAPAAALRLSGLRQGPVPARPQRAARRLRRSVHHVPSRRHHSDQRPLSASSLRLSASHPGGRSRCR